MCFTAKTVNPVSPDNLFYSILIFYSAPRPSPAQITASFSCGVFTLPDLVHNVEVHHIHVHFFHLFFEFSQKTMSTSFHGHILTKEKFLLYIVNPPLLSKNY